MKVARTLASLALVAAGLASADEAQAVDLVNHKRFWDYHVCMAVGDLGLNAPVLAQRWNVVGGMAVQASGNCVTAGYPPSRRFTIDAYNGSVSECWKVTSNTGMGVPDLTYTSGGMGLYTNNPVAWVNRECWGAYRDHYVSTAIGSVLGLARLESAGFNSRVMNQTGYSIINVPRADPYSGAVMENVYNGEYD